MPIKFRLKKILAMNEMTQKKLSELTYTRPPTISAICNNSIKQIPVGVIENICKILNVTPGDIIEYVPDEKSEPVNSNSK